MLVPLRPLMDEVLQNHSTCGFQIRIPPDWPTRYKHTPTDMQTRGHPSARMGWALLCLPSGTKLMPVYFIYFTRQTKRFHAFLCLVLPFFLSLSIYLLVWARPFSGFLPVQGNSNLTPVLDRGLYPGFLDHNRCNINKDRFNCFLKKWLLTAKHIKPPNWNFLKKPNIFY